MIKSRARLGAMRQYVVACVPMRNTIVPLMLGLCVAYAAQAQDLSSSDSQLPIGIPAILTCPDGYTGDMTVFRSPKGWKVSKWNCSNFQGLAKKYTLENWLQSNPPEIGEVRRWEERCPSGMSGTLIMNARGNRQFVESWTCSANGVSLVPWDALRPAIESRGGGESAGLAQLRSCPEPYKGNYSMGFWAGKWQLLDWTCAQPGSGKKLKESELRLMLPS